jgi:hypothetical protein
MNTGCNLSLPQATGPFQFISLSFSSVQPVATDSPATGFMRQLPIPESNERERCGEAKWLVDDQTVVITARLQRKKRD